MASSRKRRSICLTLLQVFCLQGFLNVCFYWGVQHMLTYCPTTTTNDNVHSTRQDAFILKTVNPSSFGDQPGNEYYDICMVNPGLAAAVIAERYANLRRVKVLVVERRQQARGDCPDFNIPGVNSSDHVLNYIQSLMECLNHGGCHNPPPARQNDNFGANSNSLGNVAVKSSIPCFEMVKRMLDHSHVTKIVVTEEDGLADLSNKLWCGKVHLTKFDDTNLQYPIMLREAVQSKEQGSSMQFPSSRLMAWTKFMALSAHRPQVKSQHLTSGKSMYEAVDRALALFEKDTRTIDLVISRCGEDMKWIRTLQEVINFQYIYIYNKCEKNNASLVKIQNLPSVHVVNLPNVGREGATWLHHMLRTDIKHASHNIMVQGKTETKRRQLRNLVYSLPFVQDVYHFMDLSRHPSKRTSTLRVCWTLNNFCAREYNYSELCEFCQTYSSTGRSCPQVVPTLRGEFYVSAEAIRRNILTRRSLFENLLDILNRNNDPPFGHHLERCWGEILSG